MCGLVVPMRKYYYKLGVWHKKAQYTDNNSIWKKPSDCVLAPIEAEQVLKVQ